MEMIVTILSSVLVVTIIVVFAIMILKIVDRITLGKQQSPEEEAESARIFDERLLHPDYAGVEAHLGHPIPQALRSLYEDADLILKSDLEFASSDSPHNDDNCYIAFFEPIDIESLEHNFHDSEKYLSFANDGFGNAYLIDPRQEDPAVLFHDHETDECLEVCKSLSLFIEQLRPAAPHRSAESGVATFGSPAEPGDAGR